MARLQTIYLWLLIGVGHWHVVVNAQQLQCSVTDEQQGRDPALKEMEYDIGYGPQSTLVYVEPDVTTFYKGDPPASKKVVPNFEGLAAKFINMSNKDVRLYWVPDDDYRGKEIMGVIPGLSSTATAAHVGNEFMLTPDSDREFVLERFVIQPSTNTYVYDPYNIPDNPKRSQRLLSTLSDEERRVYQAWKDTVAFNKRYKEFTGRDYLANYLRDRPIHFMWRADYFNQQHWVESKEVFFTEMPPSELMEEIVADETERILNDSQPRLLQEYRDPNQSTLNLTLTVLSCAPRVFEIRNFLSQVEIDHVMQIAQGIELKRSSVGDPNRPEDEGGITDTRTSRNSWLRREQSPILDAIYRRAADVMRIDESLLRDRDVEERPDLPDKSSMAEHLQLVHYDPGQEYTSHHDWGVEELGDFVEKGKIQKQGARFATLLLYLNDEGVEGGETAFPRWANTETFEKLRVTPEAGKAVLFYSQLPDGNMDDLSQHASLPVRAGEKWLTNLWVWDPLYS